MFVALFSAKRSTVRSFSTVRSKMSAGSRTRPTSMSASIVFQPSPSMSTAPRGTDRVPAVVGDLALGVDHVTAADGALRGHVELRVFLPLLARIGLDAHHLGDHVSGP